MAPGCTCPYTRAMDILAKRHTLAIIWLLQQESPRRFNDIKRDLDVNPVTLSTRLSELEKEGIVHRQAYAEVPPRVEYTLTAKGEDLIPLMRQLCQWAEKYEETGELPAR